MITELIYISDWMCLRQSLSRVGDLSCGGLDEYIYISLFCNKTLLPLFYYNNENIYFLLWSITWANIESFHPHPPGGGQH
jgi:hypothetical protein